MLQPWAMAVLALLAAAGYMRVQLPEQYSTAYLGMSPFLVAAVASVAALALASLAQRLGTGERRTHEYEDMSPSKARTQLLTQRYTSAMERIRRLRAKSVTHLPDIAKYSEAVRHRRQQGDGLAVLHTPVKAATVVSPRVRASADELSANTLSRTATPRNLTTATLAQLQTLFGVRDPETMTELAGLAEIKQLDPGDVVQVSTEGEPPSELWVVASGRISSATTIDGAELSLGRHDSGSLLSSSLSAIAAMSNSPAALSVHGTATCRSEVLRLPMSSRVATLIGRPLLRSALLRLERVAIFTMAQALGLSTDELQLPPSSVATSAVGPKKLISEEMALRAVAMALDIEESSLPPISSTLTDGTESNAKFKLQHFTKGEVVLAISDRPRLYVVVAGGLIICSADGRKLLTLTEGEAFGFSFCYGKEPFTVGAEASEDGTSVVVIAPSLARKLTAAAATPAKTCLGITVPRLTALVWSLDWACEYVVASAGEVVAHPKQPITHLQMILHGRLRGTQETKAASVQEIYTGETLGLVELVTGSTLGMEWRATRDSNVARLPAHIFHSVSAAHPRVFTHVCRMLAARTESMASGDSRTGSPNTVALVGCGDDCPLGHIVDVLAYALTAMGITNTTLDATSLSKGWAATSLHDTYSESAITGWLANQEEAHDVVLYVTELNKNSAPLDGWSQRCARQADLVLFVANAHREVHTPSRLELEVAAMTNARQELVLLHFDPADDYLPNGTKDFLAQRRVQRHHHVRVHTDDEGHERDRTSTHSDFARLARWISGRSVGLVLGGGGARGCSHFGVLRALEEAGVPVDLVGGTSIGAFVGGIRSGSTSSALTTERGRSIGRIMGSYWAYLRDVTLPYISFFSGSVMNAELRLVYGPEQCIEDLWLPFFAVTTSVNQPHKNPMVHKNGRVWRYVRASMSLQGYLPPLCDTDPATNTVNLLLDGGYTSNVPVQSMRAQGSRFVIAVDVASVSEGGHYDYGDSLSGWWWLWQKVKHRPLFIPMPWSSSRPKVLTMGELAAELSYCADSLRTREATDLPDLLLRPAVNSYGLLQFDLFDEIMGVGYDHATTVIELLRELALRTDVDGGGAVLASTKDAQAVTWDGNHVFAKPAEAAQLARLFLGHGDTSK